MIVCLNLYFVLLLNVLDLLLYMFLLCFWFDLDYCLGVVWFLWFRVLRCSLGCVLDWLLVGVLLVCCVFWLVICCVAW